MKKILKIVHTLSAIGLAATLLVHLFILMYIPEPSLSAEYVSLRRLIATVSDLPMILLFATVLVSGLFSMALNDQFHNVGWAWVKAALGLLMFEWILLGVSSPAQNAFSIISSDEFNLSTDEVILKGLERQEFWSLSIMLLLVAINVILAIWRPRFAKKIS